MKKRSQFLLLVSSFFSASSFHLAPPTYFTSGPLSTGTPQPFTCVLSEPCIKSVQMTGDLTAEGICTDHPAQSRLLMALLNVVESHKKFEQLNHGYQLAIAPFFSISQACMIQFFEDFGISLPRAWNAATPCIHDADNKPVPQISGDIEKLGQLIANVCNLKKSYLDVMSWRNFFLRSVSSLMGFTTYQMRQEELLKKIDDLTEAFTSHLKISSEEASAHIQRILEGNHPFLSLLETLLEKADNLGFSLTLSAGTSLTSNGLNTKKLLIKPSVATLVEEVSAHIGQSLITAYRTHKNPEYALLLRIEPRVRQEDRSCYILLTPHNNDSSTEEHNDYFMSEELSPEQAEAAKTVALLLRPFCRKQPLLLSFIVTPFKKIWLYTITQIEHETFDAYGMQKLKGYCEEIKEETREKAYLESSLRDAKNLSGKAAQLIALSRAYTVLGQLPRNIKRALLLLEQAERQETDLPSRAQAWRLLGEVYLSEQELPSHYEKAFAYLQAAASQKYSTKTADEATIILAGCLLKGKGVQRNYAEAFASLSYVAKNTKDLGIRAEALVRLGDLHLLGKGVDRYENGALSYYERSLKLLESTLTKDNHGWEYLSDQPHSQAIRIRAAYVLGSKLLEKMGGGYKKMPLEKLIMQDGMIEMIKIASKASSLLLIAASQKTHPDLSARAWLRLGIVYLFEYQFEKAKEAFLKAAAQSDNLNVQAKALIRLGKMNLFPPRGFKARGGDVNNREGADFKQAAFYFKQVSKQSSCLRSQAKAYMYRACIYLFGFGVTQDPLKAEKLLLKALNNGYLNKKHKAFYLLGQTYVLLDSDFSRASIFFKKAYKNAGNDLGTGLFSSMALNCLEHPMRSADFQDEIAKIFPRLDVCRNNTHIKSLIFDLNLDF